VARLRLGNDRIPLTDFSEPATLHVQRQDPGRLLCDRVWVIAAEYLGFDRALHLAYAHANARPAAFDGKGHVKMPVGAETRMTRRRKAAPESGGGFQRK
jgi:hypothetical protein